FYFVAYNPVRRKNRFDIVGGEFDPTFSTYPNPGGGSTTYTAFPVSGEKIEHTRTSNNWAAKITWYANPNHRIEFTGFADPSKGRRGAQNSTSLRYLDFADGGGQSDIKYGANNYAVKYNGIFSPTFFAEVQA